MIWEPFVLALVLGIIISAGLYVAYLWPPEAELRAPGVDADAAGPRGSIDGPGAHPGDAGSPPSAAP